VTDEHPIIASREPPITAYVSIGNDTGLSPLQWAKYADQITEEIIRAGGRIHADWYSLPNAHWQGRVVWIELKEGIVARLQQVLVDVARGYGQPRIMWAETPTATYLN
jgi:hypothetical protein